MPSDVRVSLSCNSCSARSSCTHCSQLADTVIRTLSNKATYSLSVVEVQISPCAELRHKHGVPRYIIVVPLVLRIVENRSRLPVKSASLHVTDFGTIGNMSRSYSQFSSTNLSQFYSFSGE